MKIPKPKQVTLTSEEAEALTDRVKASSFSEADKKILVGALALCVWLQFIMLETKITMNRLKTLLGFGSTTEKRKKDKPPSDTDSDNASDDDPNNDTKPSNDDDNTPEGSSDDQNKADNQNGDGNQKKSSKKPKPKPQGHGRNSHTAFKNAKITQVPHESLKAGVLCPNCGEGRLYLLKDAAIFVKVTCHPPASAEAFHRQILRCPTCNKTFIAKLPDGISLHRYEPESIANLCLSRFYLGNPYHRIESLQDIHGNPLPDATQWDLMVRLYSCIGPVFRYLEFLAGNGHIIYGDDTKVRILSLIKENKSLAESARKGMFTTGIASKYLDHFIILFYSGRNHMGENFGDVLKNREDSAGDLIFMSDASSMNKPKGITEAMQMKILECLCLSHGRRKFFQLLDFFPKEVEVILDKIGLAYANDKYCKENKLTPKERLAYHQEHSKPVMDELKTFLEELLAHKQVEPNSQLGDAIKYMLKHWEKLTMFLKVEGAPLDNNLIERALKIAIRLRKNSFFFKTTKSARISNEILSVIHTAIKNDCNPFDYLVALQKNIALVHEAPEKWLPWTYEATLQELNQKKGVA